MGGRCGGPGLRPKPVGSARAHEALRSGDGIIIDNARRALSEDLDILAITDEVIETAETIGPDSLRSLDAIHLASAAQLGDALTAVVAYDRRLIEGCRELEYPVNSPGLVQDVGQ